MQTDGLDRLLFADDMAECVSTEKIQNSVDQVSELCDNYDLTISVKKNRSTEDPRYSDSVCYQRLCCKIEFAVIKKLDLDPSKA